MARGLKAHGPVYSLLTHSLESFWLLCQSRKDLRHLQQTGTKLNVGGTSGAESENK